MTAQPQLDAAHRIVLGCALASDQQFSVLRQPFASLDAAALDRVLEVAAAHGVRPSVAHCFPAPTGSNAISAQRPCEVTALAQANRGRARFLTGELLRIRAALACAGVPVIPYKGPAFEHALGFPQGLREMTDLDFLVRTDHLAASTRALKPLGYVPVLPIHVLRYLNFDRVTPEWQLVRPADGLLIELHCRLAPAWFPAPCSLDDIEVQQQTLLLAGHSIAWPAPEELLLIHIADGMKSCGRGMKWIGDVARILRRHPEMDWTRIRAVASRLGGLNVVRVALALVIDCCTGVAASLGAPAIRLSVQPQAEALAAEARRTPRLAAALIQIRSAIQSDAPLPDAAAHFRWAISVSDHPLKTAAAVARYLSGPAIADLARAAVATSPLPLPARAFLRRLRVVVGLRH